MFGTYQRLGVPVWASNRAVIKALSRKLTAAAHKREHRTERHKLIRQVLAIHASQQELCRVFKL
jgi:hypothetical protein